MQGRIGAGVVGTRAGVGGPARAQLHSLGGGGRLGGWRAVGVSSLWLGQSGSHGEAKDTLRRQSGAWGRLAQGALVSAENPEPSAGWRRLGVIWPLPLASAWVAGPRARLIAPRGPPTPAESPPQPHHHRRPGDELWGPGGASGSRETRFSAVGRWPWRLLMGNGSAWSKAYVSGAEFLCLLPSFHGPCLRKAGIGQIASSMPTPGPGEVPTRRALGPESGHPRCLSGRCCDLFLEPGRDTQPQSAPPFGGGDATPRWGLALPPLVPTSPITTSISPLISFPPDFFNLQIF